MLKYRLSERILWLKCGLLNVHEVETACGCNVSFPAWKKDEVHDQGRSLAGSACSTPSEACMLIVCVE